MRPKPVKPQTGESSPPTNQTLLKVGIVGGGQGGGEMLRLFSLEGQTHIAFVADPNPQAPALQSARAAGIPTHKDGVRALSEHPVDVCIEATGSRQVLTSLQSHLPEGTTLLSSHMALTLFVLLQSRLKSLHQKTAQEMQGVRCEIEHSVHQSDGFLRQMRDIATNTELLAINASIEAAHAQAHGAAFSVVAEQMKKTARLSRDLVRDLGEMNRTIASLSTQLAESLQRLEESL